MRRRPSSPGWSALKAVSDALTIDLVNVHAYDIDGSRILVPHRVEPERSPAGTPEWTRPASVAAAPVEGTEDFEQSIQHTDEADRPGLIRLLDWAASLQQAGLARLYTTTGKGRWVLVPRVVGYGAGLVNVWNERGPSLTVFRSGFERHRALESLQRLEQILAPAKVGQESKATPITEELLDVLTQAYQEAVGS